MHGIFSIFKKKPASPAVVVKSSSKEETSPSTESNCNVDELMHTDPEVKPVHISEEPKSRKSTCASEAPRSKKKYAAPAAPEPKPEIVEVVKLEEPKADLDTENKTKIEAPHYDEGFGSPSPEPNRVSETVQEALETKMEVENHPEEKRSGLAGTYGVLHYTPQSTIRSTTRSLERIEGDSDVPYVERKSNITLTGKLRAIPVSQFDGTIGRQQKKEAAPAPPPPPLPSSPSPSLHEQRQFSDSAVVSDTNTLPSDQVWEGNRSVRDAAAVLERNSPAPYRSDSNGTSGTTREVEVASDMNLSFSERMDNNEMMQELSTSDDTSYDDDMIEAAEITREFETLKLKFERWKALQAANRNSAEARQLHMEIMHQNDTLMKKLQQTTDMAGHTGRNRPVISPETFLPWNERSRTPKLPSSTRTAPISEVHRRPALPNRWTPAPSMHSLSPATSTSSEETDRSQQYDGRRSQAVATDRFSSAGTKRPAQYVPQSSDDDERTRARLRVVQEANELKRKEQELRSTIGYSVAKDSGLMASTSRLQNDQFRGANFSAPSTLPKNYHSRFSSDSNNNAFGAQRSPGNLYQGRQPAPIPQAARQFQPSPVPKTANLGHYARGTWNGSLHSSLTSLMANNDEAMRSSPSPQPNRMSPLPEGEFTQPVNPNAILNAPISNRAPSAPDLSANNNASKFSPSMIKKNASPFEEKRENKNMPPLTPNAGSNIRKVKEAVKQQSLSQKTAANLLLQKQTTPYTPTNQEAKGLDKNRVNASNNKPKESPKIGRNNNMRADTASTVSEDEISNNIAKVLKQGLSTLKKTAPPVEKSGIVLGKVVEPKRVDDSTRTRYDSGVKQQTRPNANAPIPTYSPAPAPQEPAFAPPPPAPAPPPPAPAPPAPPPPPPAPPPPPPANLIASNTQRISSQPPYSQRQPQRGLENQRVKSIPAMNVPRAAMPDVRDSLMAEIRNAGGIRALRKVPRQH